MKKVTASCFTLSVLERGADVTYLLFDKEGKFSAEISREFIENLYFAESQFRCYTEDDGPSAWKFSKSPIDIEIEDRNVIELPAKQQTVLPSATITAACESLSALRAVLGDSRYPPGEPIFGTCWHSEAISALQVLKNAAGESSSVFTGWSEWLAKVESERMPKQVKLEAPTGLDDSFGDVIL